MILETLLALKTVKTLCFVAHATSAPAASTVAVDVGVPVATTVAVGSYGYHNRRHLGSRYLNAVAAEADQEARTIRGQFENMEIDQYVKPYHSHTHGESAAHRSNAQHHIQRCISRQGKIPYSVQRSRRDQENNVDGSRDFYWAKDTHIQPMRSTLRDEHAMMLIDVDYYVDMPYLLNRYFRPVYLYSVQPHTAAYQGTEYSFTFEGDTIQYRVSGGGGYEHKLWNYQADALIVSTTLYYCMPTTSTWQVARRRVDDQHDVIVLLPVKRWRWINSLLATNLLEGAHLERWSVQTGEFTKIEVRQKDSHTVSLARQGHYREVTLNVQDYGGILETVKRNGDKTTPYMIESLISQHFECKSDAKQAALLLSNYFAHTAHIDTTTVYPSPAAKDRINRYQYNDYDPDAKSSMVAFMAPLVFPAFAPDRTIGNDRQMVSARVKTPQDRVKDFSWTRELEEGAEKLITHILRGRTVSPVDYEQLLEEQDRPTQRAALDRAVSTVQPDLPRTSQSFMKSEAYGKPSAPRPITTQPDEDKLHWSAFAAALDPLFKNESWYAFGKTPLQIARKFANICENNGYIVEMDGEKWDGHVSRILRRFEEMFITMAFEPQWVNQAIEQWERTFLKKAKTSNGYKYETGTSRLSGSRDTSCFNTLGMLYVIFFSVYTTCGLETAIAYIENDAIVGGDDNASAPPIGVNLKTIVPAKFGLPVTVVHHSKESRTFPAFLGRVFTRDVWCGDTSSCCDIKRQLPKLHLTPHLPSNVSPEMKALEKARSFFLTDRNTPVIGKWCRHVQLRCVGIPEMTDLQRSKVRRWFDQFDHSDQWPNEYRDDFEDLIRESFPRLNYRELEKKIEDNLYLDDLLNLPNLDVSTLQDSTITSTVVINGEEEGPSTGSGDPPVTRQRRPNRRGTRGGRRSARGNGEVSAE